MIRPLTHISPLVAVLSLAATAPAHAITGAGPAAPDRFTISIAPTPVKAGAPTTIKFVARDATGATLTDYAGSGIVTDDGGGLAEATFEHGVASVVVRFPTPRRHDVIHLDNEDGTSAANGQFNVIGPVTRLDVSVPKSSAYDAPFTATITARDIAGSTVSDYAGGISWSDPGDVIDIATPGPFVKGISRTTITHSGPVRADVLHVVSDGLAADSRPFARIGPLDHIDVSAPSRVDRGADFAFAARARDAAGNLLTGFNAPATWSDDSDGLRPGVPNAFSAGVSTTTTHVDVPYRDDVITVSAGGRSAQSRPLDVVGNFSQYGLSGTPVRAKVGTPFTLVVTALDEAGNLVTSTNGAAGAQWGYGAYGTGHLDDFARGVSRTTVTLTMASDSQQLYVVDDILPFLFAFSRTFATVGPADHLDITWKPVATQTGCSGSLILRVLDSAGNLVRDYAGAAPGIGPAQEFTLDRRTAAPFSDGTSVTPLTVTNPQTGDLIEIAADFGPNVYVPAC